MYSFYYSASYLVKELSICHRLNGVPSVLGYEMQGTCTFPTLVYTCYSPTGIYRASIGICICMTDRNTCFAGTALQSFLEHSRVKGMLKKHTTHHSEALFLRVHFGLVTLL